MNKDKTKAVPYCRVSSREQEETGYSLPSQQKLMQEYADRKSFEISKMFSVAESASGAKQRKFFAEMMVYLRKNKINILLCEKVDRITRNFKEAIVISDWLEEDENRQIHFVKQNLVIHKNAKSDEKFRWDIEIVLAKKYVANLSEEVKKGQKEKIAQGWLPTKPPLGYKTTGEKGHKIHIIDEGKAPLMREMFELYSTGNHSTLSLVKVMHEKGLRTRGGGILGKSRLHMLLSDPFYYGAIKWKGEVTKGSHEPIITRQLYEKVQLILCRKLKNPQYRKHLPIFKAKLLCGECGGTVTWEIQRGHWYGHCNHYKTCNQKKWVRQEKVEEQLFPLFDKVVPKNIRVLKWLEKALKEDHAEESAANKNRREEIAWAIAVADKRMEKAYLDKLDGTIETALCQKVMENAKKEKADLLLAQMNLNEDQSTYYEAGYAIHELASQAKAIYESPMATIEEKRLLLSYVFSDMKLEEDITRPNYTLAFEFLAEWIPKLNKNFEQAKNTTKSDVLSSSLSITSAELTGEPLEPRNEFRASKSPSSSVQFDDIGIKLGVLLRGLDSNQRPIA